MAGKIFFSATITPTDCRPAKLFCVVQGQVHLEPQVAQRTVLRPLW